jgi:uncharacterized protein YgiM (DUF1202 family)
MSPSTPSAIARVTASALNVRREPSTEAEVVTQVRKGTELTVISADASWTKVRLAGGEEGWVATRFLDTGGDLRVSVPRTQRSSRSPKPAPRGGCPPDSDFAFVNAPTLTFSDRSAHGLVIVEASVNTKGNVTSTKVISNGTGDESLAFLAEREIKQATFSPPIRNCVPRAFIFTYRRTF